MKLASFRIALSLLRAPPKQFCAFPVEITRRLFAQISVVEIDQVPMRFRGSYALLLIVFTVIFDLFSLKFKRNDSIFK